MLGQLKADLKELLQWALGPVYDHLMPLVGIFTPFLYPGYLYWLFIVSALILALYMYGRAVTEDRASLRGFLRYLLPKEVYLHSSAWLDAKYYVANSVLHTYFKISAVAFAVGGMLSVGEGVRRGLELALGPAPLDIEPSWISRAGYTLVFVAAIDFSKWLVHYLQHKVPLLWEFHKVHHSAEVLTPLTNLRVHPVDVLFENFLAAISSAMVVGVYGYWYSGGVVEITILGMAAISFVASIFGLLRHSHIPLAFGPRVSKVFCSPVMHQFHHSAEREHFDKNFSVVFSLWDYLANTIYIPKRNETPRRLGIGPESAQFRSVWTLYTYPFLSSSRLLRKRQTPTIRA